MEACKTFGRKALSLLASPLFLLFFFSLLTIAIVVLDNTTLYSTGLSLGTSGIISCIFYYVVIYIPEQKQRKVIKENIRKVYANTKENIAQQIIFSSQKGGRSDLEACPETIEKMMTTAGFKGLFQEGREADEGWYAFVNQMTYKTEEYDDIIFNLRMLSRSIAIVLDNYRIDDQKTYDFFRRLEIFLAHIEHTGPGYDESKPLCRFLWEIFAGWNFIDGDVGHDVVEKLIDGI